MWESDPPYRPTGDRPRRAQMPRSATFLLQPERHVLQPHLSARDQLAVIGASDRHLPELLRCALLDRLGHETNRARDHGPQEIGVVVDADRELPAVPYRQRGSETCRALNRGGVGAAMDNAPRCVLVRTEFHRTDDTGRFDRLERERKPAQKEAELRCVGNHAFDLQDSAACWKPVMR